MATICHTITEYVSLLVIGTGSLWPNLIQILSLFRSSHWYEMFGNLCFQEYIWLMALWIGIPLENTNYYYYCFTFNKNLNLVWGNELSLLENQKGKVHCYISTVQHIPIEFLIVIHILLFILLSKYTTMVNITWKRAKSAQSSNGVRSTHDSLTKPCKNTNKQWLGGDSDNSATHNRFMT